MIDFDSVKKSKVEQMFKSNFPYSSVRKVKMSNFVVRKSIFVASYVKYMGGKEEKTIVVQTQEPENIFVNKIFPMILFLLGIIPLIIFAVVQIKKQKNFKKRIIELLNNNLPVTESIEQVDGTMLILNK